MPKYTAKTADKYELYLKSVQCVEADIDFVIARYKEVNKRAPRSLKEDFCGSFSAAVEFAARHKDNTALAVDLDAEVLDWGRTHHLPRLKNRATAVTVLQKNVLHVRKPQVDVVLAMNFSYFLFTQRTDMLAYFKNAYQSLNDGGIFTLDAYGGTESICACEEEREIDGFTYVWEQHSFNPITSEATNYIHFRFPDGSAIEKAFEYHWRVWTLREITDLLTEAGFKKSSIYWEGWDEEEECGDGIFKRTAEAENCEGWICYIVAEK